MERILAAISFVFFSLSSVLASCGEEMQGFSIAGYTLRPPRSRLIMQPKEKFTSREDALLRMLVLQFGAGNWAVIAQNMSKRSARQCRERWKNYLASGIRKSPWTPKEDQRLLELYTECGPKWQKIAVYFPGRSPNNVKNRCNTKAFQRLSSGGNLGCSSKSNELQTLQFPGFEGKEVPFDIFESQR
jgi:hypothetical protein